LYAYTTTKYGTGLVSCPKTPSPKNIVT
jgi:hypothetical protein